MGPALSRLSLKHLVGAAVAFQARLPDNKAARMLRPITGPLKGFIKRVLLVCGLYTPPDDRRVLEEVILDYLAQQGDLRRILFVGCESYTTKYNDVFKDKDYWTLEIDPQKASYGAKQHIVDSLTNIRQRFDAAYFDVIICNGVFGWGLDDKEEVEEAFKGCFECLKKDGLFVLGWNDIPARRPFPIHECHSLRLFRPTVFPPLGTSEYRAAGHNRHVYSFYVKPNERAIA